MSPLGITHLQEKRTALTEASQAIVHANVIEEVLLEASQVVEVRIAQFRAVLASLLMIFALQLKWQTAGPIRAGFMTLAATVGLFALAFSIYVILTYNKENKKKSVITLALFSIGLDATLMVLPVSLYFAAPAIPSGVPVFAGALLNQPTVFAMYLLVIASGLRFRRVALLGILVNSGVILCLMFMEALSSQVMDSFHPTSMMAIKQHILLLICSALLAWLISTHTRATTQKAAQAALQATTDALTGAFNRHHLRQRLEELFCRPDTSVHLLMIDADHFKSINDTLGHLVGDRVLIEIANRLQLALRPDDILARYGGEEFCVLLPGLGDEVALAIAERLRNAIQSQPIEGRAVTVSIGLSKKSEQDSISSLMERADLALYKAKEGGRNRVKTEWPEFKREDQSIA